MRQKQGEVQRERSGELFGEVRISQSPAITSGHVIAQGGQTVGKTGMPFFVRFRNTNNTRHRSFFLGEFFFEVSFFL